MLSDLPLGVADQTAHAVHVRCSNLGNSEARNVPRLWMRGQRGRHASDFYRGESLPILSLLLSCGRESSAGYVATLDYFGLVNLRGKAAKPSAVRQWRSALSSSLA